MLVSRKIKDSIEQLIDKYPITALTRTKTLVYGGNERQERSVAQVLPGVKAIWYEQGKRSKVKVLFPCTFTL